MTKPHLLDTIRAHLQHLYPADVAEVTFSQLQALLAATPRVAPPPHGAALDARDAMLITYGDQVRAPHEPPLRTLAAFCAARLRNVVSSVHILPFYPSTSDDGFAVADYERVDPALGDWHDIDQLGAHFKLMFDAVINHTSASHLWFRSFLEDDPRYRNFYIAVEGDPDLSMVVRPRALPLLTPFQTSAGEIRRVWTTFSADQVDLNYANPAVLLEVLRVLLQYVARGASFLRLDAIAYLWKQIGTPCIHLPQTHRVVQLIRATMDAVAPHVRLITETNVPHAENISYFGDGYNEAHLVYNFALPPLVLHTLHTGDARTLTQWARGLHTPSRQTTFLNYLASHDGIGVNPVRDILTQAEVDQLIHRVRACGGLVSEKFNSDGTRSPYELNINYFDAVGYGVADQQAHIARFVTAHAITLALRGMPALYFHSLFGSRGWSEGVTLLGYNRAINRQKLARDTLEAELSHSHTLRAVIFKRLSDLLRARRSVQAFDPFGDQEVLECGKGVFGVLRIASDDRVRALCLSNVCPEEQLVSLPWRRLLGTNNAARDAISGSRLSLHGPSIKLKPYQTLWLTT